MQALVSSEGPLPHQESRRIFQDLFPDRASVDDFQDAEEAIPGAEPISTHTPRINADGTVRTSLAMRRSSDTLRDDNGDMIIPGANFGLGQYHGSSDTVGDEETHGHGTTQTDLEKGEIGSKDKTQTQWENGVVGWDGPNDPENPQNWKNSKKFTLTVFYASMTFCITFASSVFSTATVATAKEFGVSLEVMTLGTSLFVFVSPYS